MREDPFRWQSGKATDWKPEKADVPNPETLQPRSIEQFKKEAQAFIDRFQILFQTIAGDASLRYEVGDGFYIDLKKGVITLDVKDFIKLKEGGLNPWQIVWSVCHEIGHFHDLREQPEGMMQHFAYMEERARELSPQALEIVRQKHGEEVVAQMQKTIPIGDPKEGKSKTALEAFLYKKLHLLYNSLDDMYVNRSLAERAPVFTPTGNAGGDVESLYRTYLFPAQPNNPSLPNQETQSAAEGQTPDYTKLPKSHQLAYALLRKRMVPTEEILVTQDIQDALDDYSSETAKRLGLNLRSLVDAWTTPGANGKTNPERNPVWRYARFKEKIEPVFVKFLMQDLEDLEPPPQGQDQAPSDSKDGQGDEGKESDSDSQPGDQPQEASADGKPKKSKKEGKGKKPSAWDELDEKPEHMDLDLAEKFAKEKKEQDQKKAQAEKAKQNVNEASPEERQAKAQAEADKALCKEANTDPRAAEEYRSIEKIIEPYKQELARVFDEFMRTIEERITSYLLTGFRSGKMDVAHFIKKHAPDLAHSEEWMMDLTRIDSYARKELISRLSIYPNDFRVRLVIDGSGSMSGDGKIEMARKIAVLLLEGLATFEETINLRYRLQTPFHADTEVRVFGDGDVLAKPFKSDDPAAYGATSKFKALVEVQANGSTTVDAPSFEAIDTSLDQARTKKLREGKAKELVIYVADGGSVTAEESKRSIASIQEKGAICKGLLIGNPSSDEQATFDSMLGRHGSHVPEITKLASVILELLREEIQNTSVQVSAYEDTGTDSEL